MDDDPADSKQLTEEQRDKLFDAIKAAPDTVGWTVTVLQPQHISESMLRKYTRGANASQRVQAGERG